MPADLQLLHATLKMYALGLPGAVEEHPWGESCAKVGGKVFAFLGHGDGEPGLSVKLPQSSATALTLPGCTPTGYGLGRSGWVSVRLQAEGPDEDTLIGWIEESWRAVAPKKLVRAYDAQG